MVATGVFFSSVFWNGFRRGGYEASFGPCPQIRAAVLDATRADADEARAAAALPQRLHRPAFEVEKLGGFDLVDQREPEILIADIFMFRSQL